MVFGAVFLLLGVLGFIPGVTQDHEALRLGPHSHALLFGVFAVSVVHNLMHVVFGAVGFAASTSVEASRVYLLASGLVYAVLALTGALVPEPSSINVLGVNPADTWLHAGLGLGLLAAGVVAGWRR